VAIDFQDLARVPKIVIAAGGEGRAHSRRAESIAGACPPPAEAARELFAREQFPSSQLVRDRLKSIAPTPVDHRPA
jgi:hypothetical protein